MSEVDESPIMGCMISEFEDLTYEERTGWIHAMAAVRAARRCPVSGTIPDPDEYQRSHLAGGYRDGGFHHCDCGAVVEWVPPSEQATVAEHFRARSDWVTEVAAGPEVDGD